MVYNRIEIKKSMTKERRCDFATTLSMKFFCFGSTARFDVRGSVRGNGAIHILKPFDIVQIVQFFYSILLEPT